MHTAPELFFQMLADTTRLRIAMLLQCYGELCVCELTHALVLSQPKISRHLGQMRESELVQTRRAGRWMYYRLKADCLSDCCDTLTEVLGQYQKSARQGRPGCCG